MITRKPCRIPLNWSRRRSGRQEEASGQQIEPGPAEHLALEQLQAVDLAFDGSLAPGQRDGGLDGGIVRLEPSGETPEGRERTGGCTCQPRLQGAWLTPADEGGKVLREGHRLRQLGRLRSQLRQLMVILYRRPCRRTEDQPGGPARREQAPGRLRHRRQRLGAASLPGGQPLGLAHASDIKSHNPLLAPKPLAADRPEQTPAIATAVVPPGQEGRFVWVEETAATAMSRLALGERRALEVAPHGAATEPDLVRDRVQRPALPMVAPDLLVGGHPLGPPGGGDGQRPYGGLWGCERYGGEARGIGRVCRIVHGRRHTGVLGMDARQLRGVGPEHVGQHVREVLQQVKPVRHLAGRRRPEARRFRIRLGPIAHNDLNLGMGLKPRGDSGGLAIGEQGQGPPLCEVQQEGALGVTLP
jgi:hypothetical protein